MRVCTYSSIYSGHRSTQRTAHWIDAPVAYGCLTGFGTVNQTVWTVAGRSSGSIFSPMPSSTCTRCPNPFADSSSVKSRERKAARTKRAIERTTNFGLCCGSSRAAVGLHCPMVSGVCSVTASHQSSSERFVFSSSLTRSCRKIGIKCISRCFGKIQDVAI